MAKIDITKVGKRIQKMAARRDIDLSKYERETTFDSVSLGNDVPADELIERLEELAHEHVQGDFSKLEVAVNAEASEEWGYDLNSERTCIAYVDTEEIIVCFEREETDKEAARRILYEFDKKKK